MGVNAQAAGGTSRPRTAHGSRAPCGHVTDALVRGTQSITRAAEAGGSYVAAAVAGRQRLADARAVEGRCLLRCSSRLWLPQSCASPAI